VCFLSESPVVSKEGSNSFIVETMENPYWVVVSNIFYFHPDPWGNDPI